MTARFVKMVHDYDVMRRDYALIVYRYREMVGDLVVEAADLFDVNRIRDNPRSRAERSSQLV